MILRSVQARQQRTAVQLRVLEYRRSTRRSVVASVQGANTVAELKRNVLRAAGGTNRGKTATSGQRAAILSLLQRLEACNTTSDPAQSPLLNGTWALLYQAPLDEARAEVDKSGTTEGPFLAALQPAGRGVIRTKSNLQLIDIPGGRVENKAEFRVLDRWDGSLNIRGSAKQSAARTPSGGAARVDVQFDDFVLSVGSWSTVVSLGWVQPRGWVETTYLDGDVRVGRGDKGSIFFAARVKPGSGISLPDRSSEL